MIETIDEVADLRAERIAFIRRLIASGAEYGPTALAAVVDRLGPELASEGDVCVARGTDCGLTDAGAEVDGAAEDGPSSSVSAPSGLPRLLRFTAFAQDLSAMPDRHGHRGNDRGAGRAAGSSLER